MKKTIKYFGFIAVAAMAIVGCAKEIDAPKEELIEEPQEKVIETHTVTITAGSPETKTSIVEGVSSASFKWSSDDASRFHIFENSVEGSSVALETSDEYVTVKLTATFATETAASYTYTAFLAKNVYNDDYPQVPSAQTCTGSTYDPDADILIAKPVTNEGAVLTKLNMQFGRPCVINKMTLKGLTEGETLSSVEIYADKPLTGYYDIAGKSWTGESQKITLTTSQEVPASGQVTVYFVTMPVADATLTVTAITDAHVYNKTFGSTINFVLDQVTKFGVSSLGKYVKRDVLTYATAAFNAASGSYKAWSNKSYEGVGYSAAVYAGQSCEINASDKTNYGEYIQLRNTSPSGIITTTSGGSIAKVFVIFGGKSNVDKRALTVYGKNTAYTATTDLYDSVTYGEELGAITFNTGDKFGYLNIDGYGEYVGLLSGDGAMYFREIQFFWNNTKEPSGLKWTADGNAGVAVAAADASVETGPDTMPAAALYNPNSIALDDITFSSTNTSVATIGEHTGVITLVGEGDTEIHAVFAGNSTYKNADVYYTLSVTDDRTTPVITLNETDENRTTSDYDGFTGRSATVSPSVALTYSKEDINSVIDNFNVSTGALTLTGNTGSATVTVSYAGSTEYKPAVSKSYTIYVVDPSKTLSSITVTTAPTKVDYLTTESTMSLAGAVITATYSDASTSNVTASCTITNAASILATAGISKSATVSYTESGVTKTTNYSVDVYDPTVTYTTGIGGAVATVSSGSTSSKVRIGSTNYDCVKANKAATFTISVPSGSTKVHLFIAAWNGEDHNVTVTGGTMSSTSITADSGISGGGTTYTLAGTISGYYKVINLSSNTTTEVTIKCAANKRAVIWGINAQ